ncbi:retrotransposon hot spot (RHS) protein, putative, partial [Trypanosoma cruzi]
MMWRCCGRLHVALLRRRWASAASLTGVAVRLHGAPTTEPCECHAQRHWDSGRKQPRVCFGASGTCWPQLGGASGMLHRTGVVMAPRRGSCDGSDAAARRGVEGMRRPQWTMSSAVEDVLLEGSTLRTDMKLNDFLRGKLGGRAVVDADHKVTMEEFVRRPNAYVQDQRLLKRIFNLTAYQELEAINKLHSEGVLFLEQWRDYEGKDTITPLARGKLNAVLSQIQREILEAEERLIREEEERRRRAQEMKFTISTTIEDVLFRGEFRYREMKLNDFLLLRFGGKGIVATKENVLLEEFFKDPARYIHDEGVLNEIKASDGYLRMERTVKGEVNMEEDVKKLHYNHVISLLGWSLATPEVKEIVHWITKQSLDAALEDVRNPMRMSASNILKGFYESVYNARWSHVVEVPGSEGTGLEVKEGKPPQQWTYKKGGYCLEKDDGVQQSGEATPVLMVLTSDKGWPYTLNAPHGAGNDLCVNSEVERVWRIVKRDLTKWFSSHGKKKP